MGIEDIQISEELETNAPSIKYRGNEGPKSPQEEQMMMLIQKLMSQGMGQEEAMQMAQQMMAEAEQQQMAQQQMAPQGMPPRQMAAFGGIMGLDGRRKYGFGSSLKKFVRNIIPNEVADIAVKAAPFVAMIPGQQGTAALMRGLGRFDQRGSISDALKQGALTYGFGKIASPLTSKIPGIGTDYSGLGGFKQFGADLGGSIRTGFGNLAKGTAPKDMSKFNELGLGGSDPSGIAGAAETAQAGLTGDAALYESIMGNPSAQIAKQGFTQAPKGFLGNTIDKISQYIPTSLSDLNPMSEGFGKKALGAAGLLTLGTKLLGGGPEETVDEIMDRGEGLDIEGIRAEVTEAFKDQTGEKLLALRTKYPYLGTQRSKNTAIMADGGRAGYGLGSLVRGSSMAQPVSASMSEGDAPVMSSSGMGGMLSKLINNNPQLFKNVSGQNNSSSSPMPSGGMGGMFSKFFSNPRMYNQYFRDKEDFIDENFNDIDDREEVAMGGRIRRAEGGLMDLGGMEKDYRAEGGFVPIGEYEKKDDVPARLSVNEFVFTADAVRGAGQGDIDKGAEIMENVMKNLEQGGQLSEESQGMQGARDMFQTSQRLGEVI